MKPQAETTNKVSKVKSKNNTEGKVMTTKQCKHVYWNDRKNKNYICEKCGDIKQTQPPNATFETCKKCKHYPCDISREAAVIYSEKTTKILGAPKSHGYILSCPHLRIGNPGGFIDIDGKRYRYKTHQHPFVEYVPMNIVGTGGVFTFNTTLKCKCCDHVEEDFFLMWEPQFEEFVKTHPNHKITFVG
jgi:hypothetical protein